MPAIIEAKHLTKKYGDFTAVNAIDFAIEPQECFGFLGPNGAGKTTTMKMIYGVSPVTSGELCVAGMDVRNAARAIKAIIGVVPQEDNLDPDLSVIQNLLVYGRYFDIPMHEARKRAMEVLQLMQLDERQNSSPAELSGGMKRRLIIARALINNPRVMVLDEPTTGLDPQARHLVWQKLRFLKTQGVTLVLTTHYMEEAAQLCDRLVIMHEGDILTLGKPDQLVEEMVGHNVLEFRLAPSEKPKALAQIEILGLPAEDVGDGIYVFGREGHDLDQLPKRLDVQIDSYLYRQATLEDVFLKLAGRELRE
jgi:lipooligosaccharide transport system ATP-binding protein